MSGNHNRYCAQAAAAVSGVEGKARAASGHPPEGSIMIEAGNGAAYSPEQEPVKVRS